MPSAALVDRVQREGAHRVVLASDGRGLRWVLGDGPDAAADDGFEPGTEFCSRLPWNPLSPFVPVELL